MSDVKSFNVVTRIHQLPDGNTAQSVRNVFVNSLYRTPWDVQNMNIYVEEIRPMPSLNPIGPPLSPKDAEYLRDLREVMITQRAEFSRAIRRITRRLEVSYQGTIPPQSQTPPENGEDYQI